MNCWISIDKANLSLMKIGYIPLNWDEFKVWYQEMPKSSLILSFWSTAISLVMATSKTLYLRWQKAQTTQSTHKIKQHNPIRKQNTTQSNHKAKQHKSITKQSNTILSQNKTKQHNPITTQSNPKTRSNHKTKVSYTFKEKNNQMLIEF